MNADRALNEPQTCEGNLCVQRLWIWIAALTYDHRNKEESSEGLNESTRSDTMSILALFDPGRQFEGGFMAI